MATDLQMVYLMFEQISITPSLPALISSTITPWFSTHQPYLSLNILSYSPMLVLPYRPMISVLVMITAGITTIYDDDNHPTMLTKGKIKVE